MAQIAFKIIFKGKVQRVGFRRYALDQAQELSLKGYTKNLPDGSVEVFAQGRKEQLDEFFARLSSPPPPIVIKEAIKEEARVDPKLDKFDIIYGRLEEELQEGFGAMQSVFMNYWSEFKDYRSEFKDYRSEFQDYRNEFRDFRSEFRDFRSEFREFRNEFREFAQRTDKNFQLILEKYGEISNKLTTILETLVKESKESRERENRILELLVRAIEKISEKS